METGGGAVTVNLATGIATDTFGDTDTLSGIQNVIGTSGADTFTTASSGVDTFTGGAGNDTYNVKAGDIIVENAGGGTDSVFTTDSYTLEANVENLTLQDKTGSIVSNTQTFDNLPLGPITNGEAGWEILTSVDQAVVTDPNNPANQVFHISSDPSNGAFAGPFSPALSASAGEPDTGAAFNGQSISFNFQAVSASPTDGSRLEVDFGNAAGTDRNNFLVIENTANGLRIAVSEPTADGQDFTGDETDPAPNDWRELVAGVNPNVQHTLEMRLDYVDGANNDVIGVYLDGQLIGETTTFENFHDGLGGTHITNAQANLTDRVIFRESNNGQPQDGAGGQNQGFNFDNLTTSVYNNTSGTGNAEDNIITGNSGDNVLTGLAGNDTLNGGVGIDTAVYQDARSNYTIAATTNSHGLITSFTGVTETGANAAHDGTDSLTSIERLQFGSGPAAVTLDVNQKVQLFDSTNHLIGTFDHIQDAINAGADGDKIVLAAGTYDENVSLSKNIEIDGANSGTAGTGARGAESVIMGQMTVSAAASAAAHVIINGVEIYNTSDTAHPFVGINVTSATDVTVTNSVFFSPVPNGNNTGTPDRAIQLTTGATGTVDIDHNLFTGASHAAFSTASWTTGIWSDGAQLSGTIDSNTFEFVRTAINADDFSNTLAITHNTVQNSGSGVSIGVGTDASSITSVSNITSIHDNTFTNVDTDFNLQNVTTPIGFDLTATNNQTSGVSSGTVLGGTAGDTIKGSVDNDILIGNGNNDTLTGGGGSNTLVGGAGIDTATGYSAGATIAIANGHWVVNHDGSTDVLTGIEQVVIAGKTYLLVDQTGANVGGFQHVQDAINAAPASGGATILIAPGSYSESNTTASGAAGIYIDKPDLTLQGVDATGALITTVAAAETTGATIISAHQNDFGANDWIDVGGTNTVIQGLHLQAGPETDNKLLEIWANNVTVENDFVDVNKDGQLTYSLAGSNTLFDPLTGYTGAVAIYLNDNGDPLTDNITAYNINHNFLNEGIVVANGVGDPSLGIGANQLITNNDFGGTFDPNTGLGRYDTVVINGQVNGIGWLLEPTQTPTIAGNTVRLNQHNAIPVAWQ